MKTLLPLTIGLFIARIFGQLEYRNEESSSTITRTKGYVLCGEFYPDSRMVVSRFGTSPLIITRTK